MTQPDLFASNAALVDDASGRIVYTPGWLPQRLADACFRELREGIEWHANRRRMYDREVDVPRLTASFATRDPTLPAALALLRDRLSGTVATRFNSIGLNLYRDHRDSVAPHSDHPEDMVEGSPVVLVSLGGARLMVISSRRPPRRVLKLDLEPGSLLEMDWQSQLDYLHGIPKQRTPAGPRISLAFRVRPDPTARAWG